jgi:hypothetical protein
MGGMDGGGGRGHGGGRNGSAGASSPAAYYHGAAPPLTRVTLTPHGGQFLSTEAHKYEIVYMPLQARIYRYDEDGKPLSARNVHVQMSLQPPTENAVRKIPFQYVVLPAGTTEQDYVVAAFDFRQWPEKETPITFEFSGLASRRNPTASFTPLISRSDIRPYVAQVLPVETDRDGILRQRVCPVSGAMLGSKGPIVKLYIADYPLYVSGQDCVSAVEEAPEKYLPRPSSPTAGR